MTTTDTINVGLLHSLTGPMANSERHVLRAALLAFEEINAGGGVLGRHVNTEVEDGASSPQQFAARAEHLLTQRSAVVLFGCWTSSSRKAVRPVVERHNALLWYPVQYEGLEQSHNIFYTGACPNQQITPAVDWALGQGVRRVVLIGSDYVYPRVANHLLRALLESGGATVAAELYTPLAEPDFNPLLAVLESHPVEMIFNTVNGIGNAHLFRRLAAAGYGAEALPVMSFSFSEIELGAVRQHAAGHFACRSYFDGEPPNVVAERFALAYRDRYGANAPIASPMASAYAQVHLWKAIVECAGSFDTDRFIACAPTVSVNAPWGQLRVQANHHTSKPALIGRATDAGRFEVIARSDGAIAPKPWLGLEDQSFATRDLVFDALAQYPDIVDNNFRLQSEIRRRENTEALLAQKTAHLRLMSAAVEQSPVSIIITDRIGTIQYVNPRFVSHSGYALHEVIGTNASRLKSGNTQPSVYKSMWHSIAAGKAWRGEFANMKKDGSPYWVMAVVAPLMDNRGQIINFIAIEQDISERKQFEKQLEQTNTELRKRIGEVERLQASLREQAMRDPLTQLYNRNFMDTNLQRQLEISHRESITTSIILMDIDKFKTVNDRYGHQGGDAYLRFIAERINTRLRKADWAARYGGEEFIIVLSGADGSGAWQWCEQLRQNIATHACPHQGIQIQTTASIGIAAFPDHGSDAEELIGIADQALYTAKRRGRNRTILAGGPE